MSEAGREEVVRRGFEAWNAGDLEALVELLDPDLTFRLSGAFPGLGREYRGHDGFRQFWGEFREMWETITVTLESTEDLDPLLLAGVQFAGVGREGIRVAQVFWFVFEFAEGRIAVSSAHQERDAAIEVAEAARREGSLLRR